MLFAPDAGYEVEIRGEEYLILRERDVHAVASTRRGSDRPLPVALVLAVPSRSSVCRCASVERHRHLGRVAHRRGDVAPPAAVEVLDDLAVELRCRASCAARRAIDSVHGLGPDERLRAPRCTTSELLAALAPAVAAELGERRDHGAVVLLLVDPAQRELPAHLGLHVAVVLPGAHRVDWCSAQPGPVGEAGPVEEDARVVDEPGAPLVLPSSSLPTLA